MVYTWVGIFHPYVWFFFLIFLFLTSPYQPKDKNLHVPEQVADEIRYALCRIAGTGALDIWQINNDFWSLWPTKLASIYYFEQSKLKQVLFF